MAKDGLQQDMLSIVLNKDVSVMCNLSQGIVDETRAETRAETKAEIIMNMYENNFTVQQISLATKQSVEEVEGIIMFFASTFWTKLQNIFGHCCKTFLDIVACPNWTKLQCPGWLRNNPAVKPLQTLFNCYSTRYGNGSSEFSSSCACSLKY